MTRETPRRTGWLTVSCNATDSSAMPGEREPKYLKKPCSLLLCSPQIQHIIALRKKPVFCGYKNCQTVEVHPRFPNINLQRFSKYGWVSGEAVRSNSKHTAFTAVFTCNVSLDLCSHNIQRPSKLDEHKRCITGIKWSRRKRPFLKYEVLTLKHPHEPETRETSP
jgi:hypothetical protein